jgi:hypothetical protein
MSIRNESDNGWRVWWSATEGSYQVLVCQRARIVHRFRSETLGSDSMAGARMQAAARAVELALEYRVPLASVIEERAQGS